MCACVCVCVRLCARVWRLLGAFEEPDTSFRPTRAQYSFRQGWPAPLYHEVPIISRILSHKFKLKVYLMTRDLVLGGFWITIESHPLRLQSTLSLVLVFQGVRVANTGKENYLRVVGVYCMVLPACEATECSGRAPRGNGKFQCVECVLFTYCKCK